MDIQMSQSVGLWERMTDLIMDRVGNDMGKNGCDTLRIWWIEWDVSQWAIDTVAFESLYACLNDLLYN